LKLGILSVCKLKLGILSVCKLKLGILSVCKLKLGKEKIRQWGAKVKYLPPRLCTKLLANKIKAVYM
jgi:hypothetical protein